MPPSRRTFPRGGGRPAALAVFALLGVVYAVLFVRLYPCVPWNCDDWTYLGLFHSVWPSLDRWNPARIFQEFFMPLSGYFAAYVLRPVFGLDYLQALTLTCSGLAAAAWFTLSVWAYRFFLSAARARVPALWGLLLLNAGFFLARALRLPLVISEPVPSILFAYDLPNILNAGLVLALGRAILGHGNSSLADTPLSAAEAQKHAAALAGGLILIYFAQFSMTVSSAISAIPAGSLLLFRLVRRVKNAGGRGVWSSLRQGTFLDLFCGLLVVFWFTAAGFDLGGGRFASLSPAPRPFLTILALYGHALGACIPPYLWLALIFLVAVNTLLPARDGKNRDNPDHAALRLFLKVMGLSFALLLTLNIAIFYVANIGLDNRFFFGLAFYFYLTLIVNAFFLQKRLPLALVGLMPLPVLLFAGAALAEPWMPRPVFYAEYRIAVVRAWLSDITEADRAGEEVAVIRTPTPDWPHPKDYLGDRLARTLFHHGITSRHLAIHTESPE